MAKILPYDRRTRPPPKEALRIVATLLFAAFGAPAAWSVQLILNYALTAEACFPNDRPLRWPTAVLTWDRPTALVINVLALLVGAAATWTAWRLWRQERAPGAQNQLVVTRDQRICFMALCGLMTGFGFMAAILFNTVAAVGMPQCSD